jgi:outer membrane protein OmpU
MKKCHKFKKETIMNKFKKIGLSALAASLVSVSANAADVSIAGGAGLTFTGGGDHVTGNGFGMNDSLTFTWGGELDNGFTVDLNFKLDNSDGAAGQILDNRSLTIGMGSAGNLAFWGQASDSVISAHDDKMPTAYEESFDGASGPGRGHTSSNMFYYTNDALDGVGIDVSYTPSGGDTNLEGTVEMGVEITAVDGLTIGFASGEDRSAGTGKYIDNTIAYITYAFGSVTVGYQANESDDAQGATTTAGSATLGDLDYTAMSISYAVNEDLSVSLGTSTIDYESASTSDQESTSLNASYTMGSMAWKVQHADHANAGGLATNDYKEYEIGLSFSF